MWLKVINKDGPNPEQLDRHTVTPRQAIDALAESGRHVSRVIATALAGDGRVKYFKPDVAGFIGYAISHDAHHRGQISMLARQAGYPLSQKAMFGMWSGAARQQRATIRNPKLQPLSRRPKRRAKDGSRGVDWRPLWWRKQMPKQYWLMKSEPSAFSIDAISSEKRSRSGTAFETIELALHDERDEVGDQSVLRSVYADPTAAMGVMVISGVADPPKPV